MADHLPPPPQLTLKLTDLGKSSYEDRVSTAVTPRSAVKIDSFQLQYILTVKEEATLI
jgi:hypothetical protein